MGDRRGRGWQGRVGTAGHVIPSGLAERLFSVLFDDYDLLTVDGTTMAIPKDGSIPVFTGSTLGEIALQIASYRGDDDGWARSPWTWSGQ